MKVGIDTSLSMLALVPGTNMTVYDDCVAWLGHAPDFVIRPTGTGGGAATPASVGEVARILAKGPKVGLYYNDSRLNGKNPPVATYSLGLMEGREACAQLSALGAPSNLPVLLDIESTAPVTPAYLQGFEAECASQSRRVCVYGIVTPGSTLANAITSSGVSLDVWAANWTSKGANYDNAANTQMPNLGAIKSVMCQITGAVFNGVADEDIEEDAYYEQMMWNPGATPVTSGVNAKDLLSQAISLLQKAQGLL